MGLEGSQFGQYILLEQIGSGGMGEIWKAKKILFGDDFKYVALKRILPHLAGIKEFLQDFINEARLASKFTHPNIVQIYDVGKINEFYFIEMEYIHGRNLGQIFHDAEVCNLWMTETQALTIIHEICKGLYYAHEAVNPETGQRLNIVHRDISPQNIMITYQGEIKITDFGIAKASISGSHTKSGVIKGKPNYLAPEQILFEGVDHRSDIFALGVVAFELLTGQYLCPIGNDTNPFTIMNFIQKGNYPAPSQLNSKVSRDIDLIVLKMLAKDKAKRYLTAEEIQEDIEKYWKKRSDTQSLRGIRHFMNSLYKDRANVYKHKGIATPIATPGGTVSDMEELKEQALAEQRNDDTEFLRPAASPTEQKTDASLNSSFQADRLADEFQDDEETHPGVARNMPASSAASANFVRSAAPAAPRLKDSPRTERSLLDTLDIDEEPTETRAVPRKPVRSIPKKSPLPFNQLFWLLIGIVLLIGVSGMWYLLRDHGRQPADLASAMGFAQNNANDDVIEQINKAASVMEMIGDATLELDSTPPGARIYIKGKPFMLKELDGSPKAAKTPVKITQFSQGETLNITLKKEGYYEINETLLLKDYQKLSYSMKQIPQSCELLIQSEPSGATVSIDGKNVGNTPYRHQNISPESKLKIRVAKTGYHPDDQDVLMLDATQTIQFTLKQIKVDKAAYLIYADQPSAQVFVDDKLAGTMKESQPLVLDNLIVGQAYNFAVFKPGYKIWREKIAIQKRGSGDAFSTATLEPYKFTMRIEGPNRDSCWINSEETNCQRIPISLGKNRIKYNPSTLGEAGSIYLTVNLAPDGAYPNSFKIAGKIQMSQPAATLKYNNSQGLRVSIAGEGVTEKFREGTNTFVFVTPDNNEYRLRFAINVSN